MVVIQSTSLHAIAFCQLPNNERTSADDKGDEAQQEANKDNKTDTIEEEEEEEEEEDAEEGNDTCIH